MPIVSTAAIILYLTKFHPRADEQDKTFTCELLTGVFEPQVHKIICSVDIFIEALSQWEARAVMGLNLANSLDSLEILRETGGSG